MAEVEAICAKLQSNPVRSQDDRTNCQTTLSTGPGDCKFDEFLGHRRKRKANAPRYRTNNSGKINPDDRSCGALDLTVCQQSQSDPDESDDVTEATDCSKNGVGASSFLQNPLVNIFMNNRGLHDNFNCLLEGNKPYDFTSDKKSQPVMSSALKNEEERKNSIVKAADSDSANQMLAISQIIEKNSTAKESPTSQTIENHEECIKRFSSFEDCKEEQCRQSLLRDHFHCLQCKKIIMRREEMIRHSKWHKKREESLQFNFMRFSPGDDCKELLCSYNGRQTHYHCLHPDCNKIYISTSDVQMHSNFHKKDAAINQEGFQRYRATEFCCIPTCSYNNQRTTHFHCMRENCKFTFKNKADMDKHKGHHQRNDTLSKEGFRKYIKYEHCDYNGCKFSKLMNHIHCIRSNCDYVVHSSAQINSHRRKHERRILTSSSMIPSDHKSDSSSILNLSKTACIANFETDESIKRSMPLDSEVSPLPASSSYGNNCQFINQVSIHLKDWENSSEWIQETRRFTANDPCVAHCCLMYKDHYHCLSGGCNVAFRIKEKIRDHCRRHKIDKLLLEYCYDMCTETEHLSAQNNGNSKPHYHCKWTCCNYVRAGPEGGPEIGIDFNFLQEVYDHFDFHESRFHGLVNRSGKVATKIGNQHSSDESSANSDIYQFNIETEKADSFYNNAERKRGRPPKYKKNIHIPKIELNDEELNDDELVMELTKEHFTGSSNGIKCGFKFYPASNVFCADDMCMYYGRSEHFHCLRARCHQATDSLTAVNLHRREFHHYMQIDLGYEYFDRSINCRRSQCQNNRVNNHYHCVRQNCDYSFKRFNTMHQHTRKHLDNERQKCGSSQPLEDLPPASLKPENPVLVSPANYSANAFLSDYSRSFNSLFSFNGKCPSDNINLPIIPTLPNSITGPLTAGLNLSSLMNFNSQLSPFNNSFKAFMNSTTNTNSNCFPMFSQPATKIPRL